MMVYVMMEKRHLDYYIAMLDERINYLKLKISRDGWDDHKELSLLHAMRNHAFDALERL